MRNYIVIFVMFFSLLVIACNKEKKCNLPRQRDGSGLIIKDVMFQEPPISWGMRYQQYIIRTDSQNIFNIKVKFENDTSYNLIDFSKYTLLGKHVLGNCEAVFERNVIEDQNIYTYLIRAYRCGYCPTDPIANMNWVLVDRIAENDSVAFHEVIVNMVDK